MKFSPVAHGRYFGIFIFVFEILYNYFTDIMILRRNVLGLISLLEKEDMALISTATSSAIRSFNKAAEQMGLQYLKPMQCFYSLGVCGHVIVWITDNNPNEVRIKIRAQSERKLSWFKNQMKSVLSDYCKFVPITLDDTVANIPASHLNSVLSLLSNAEVIKDDEASMIEETAAPLDSALDNIRKEFLRKQGKVLGMTKGRSGSFKIPIDQYREWQDKYYVIEKVS